MLWCMQRTNIYLEERQTAALDLLARRLGVTRAEVVRQLIDRGLDEDAGAVEDDVQVIEASFGALADDEPAPLEREVGARDRYLDRLWRR